MIASAYSRAHDKYIQRISERCKQNNEFATSIVYSSSICASLYSGPSLKKISEKVLIENVSFILFCILEDGKDS